MSDRICVNNLTADQILIYVSITFNVLLITCVTRVAQYKNRFFFYKPLCNGFYVYGLNVLTHVSV